MKMMPQQYCLRWKHHHSNVQNMFAQLLEKERFCDVTLYCSPSFAAQAADKDAETHGGRGVSLRAHRVVLAACSELLGSLLGAHESLGEPVLVIDGAEPRHVRALLDYMYTGEMNVHHSQLASLLKTAEELRIKGLTDVRWSNKDEPPDCTSGVITTTSIKPDPPLDPKPEPARTPTPAPAPAPAPPAEEPSPEAGMESLLTELRAQVKRDEDSCERERFSVNGGPPPLIKLPAKERGTPPKREHSDSDRDSRSPKRRRHPSGADHTDEDSLGHSRERDLEWQHGNLNITAERVVGWGMGSGPWSREASDDEWADAPADIGSFLHTRLRVDGDNSADEESNSSSPAAASKPSSAASSVASAAVAEPADAAAVAAAAGKPTIGPKSGPTDPRFTDVVKLNEYLQFGRRPQFWEEHYVRRVMEAVRQKELEMKQAAEILGVSYGTLYGRYRDVYGCINRPYRTQGERLFFDRTARDFWQAKGPSEVLERLQRGEISLDAASTALGVAPANLAAYFADVQPPEKEFEPIPIEVDPSLKIKPRPLAPKKYKSSSAEKSSASRRVVVSSVADEEAIPAAVIAAVDKTPPQPNATGGKWPSIRVASIDALRADTPTASPSALMRTRPDLTIVAARRQGQGQGDA